MITRIDPGSRFSQAVVTKDMVYLAGQVGEPGTSVSDQTRSVLAKIDELLVRAGSRKELIVQALIWLADMNDYDEMNAAWDEWVPDNAKPARATGEVRLAEPEYKVEIIVTAAVDAS
jgi:enamine deaminase RidA (YjgF/YER057c/UK114 family)